MREAWQQAMQPHCSEPGCTTAAQSDSLCNHHDGGRCSIPGCTTSAYRSRRCKRHKLSPRPSDPGPSNLSDLWHSTAVSPATSRPPIVHRDMEKSQCEFTAVRGAHLTLEQRMQALTETSQYSGPSWPDIRERIERAKHVQPRHVTTLQLPTSLTPTLVTAQPIEDGHLTVGGVGIQVSARPAR